MPCKIVRAEEMRAIEEVLVRELGVPSIVLMEHAAAGVVRAVAEAGYADDGVLIVCGTGNNGGDGLCVLRQLLAQGVRAEGILLGRPDRLKGDARLEWDMLERAGVRIRCVPDQQALEPCAPLFEQAGCIVDAVFGTGLSRPVEGLQRAAIQRMNAAGRPVVAVDIPSGVDSDTGRVLGTAVRAALTVTFQYPKFGHFLFPGKGYAGRLIIHPIGLVPEGTREAVRAAYLDADDVGRMLPARPQDAHKGSFGRVGVVAGSMGMAGAGLMCARAALRAGAGLVTLCSGEELGPVYQSALPEAMFLPLLSFFDQTRFTEFLGRCSAVVLGPGLGRAAHVGQALKAVLEMDGLRAVVDADAINAFCTMEAHSEVRANAVFTPHVGEMARLCGLSAQELLSDPVTVARAQAGRLGAVVVLKSAATVIAAPDGRVVVNTTGTPAMAKGGTGDVLCGLIAALMAQGLAPFDAAALGCRLLGLAGERAVQARGEYGVLASDIADALPLVMRR
jgi:NAD(P)H-hydrate epimerase